MHAILLKMSARHTNCGC